MNQQNDTHHGTDDLRTLTHSALEDIGAIFQVLADRPQSDTATTSLCKTGIYLCDKWSELILAEIAFTETTKEKNRSPLSREDMTKRIYQINLPGNR